MILSKLGGEIERNVTKAARVGSYYEVAAVWPAGVPGRYPAVFMGGYGWNPHKDDRGDRSKGGHPGESPTRG